MDVLSTKTKGQAGWTAAKTVVQNPRLRRLTVKSVPPLTKLTVKVGKPLAKRKARGRLQEIGERLTELGEALFEIGEVVGATMAVYGPLAARQLGWAEAPKQKRTGPRVVAGAVIGASAMYFLEPKCGPERREQVLRLFYGTPPASDGAPPPST